MASRHSAARPKRAGENYARAHHGEGDEDSKRVKFDIRNPSTLAPDAREDDAVLDADVIGAGGGTKRGAVNIDGYDSDSDNETFNARAERRSKNPVNILEQLDNYDAKSGSAEGKPNAPTGDGDDNDDDDDDMFADDNGAVGAGNGNEAGEDGNVQDGAKKKKDVRFLDADQIQGQVENSTSGGQIHINEESSDDEADVDLAIQEEGVDNEVGAGGLKRNAPKVEAFNLREEMEEGQFDQEGNYLRKGGDPDAVHDNWLDGLSKKDMKKAAEAHQKRVDEARKQRLNDDSVLVPDLLRLLIERLEIAETPMEALARLGKRQAKPKKIPQWKLKKMGKSADGMDIDKATSEDSEQTRIRETINAITDAADKLLSRDYEEIYDQERELLIREYQRESGEEWEERRHNSQASDDDEGAGDNAGVRADKWEFRWINRDDGSTQGPFDNASMKAWQDAGYFADGVEFRPYRESGNASEWTQTAIFE